MIDFLVSHLSDLARAADPNVTGVSILKPDREAEKGWTVVTRQTDGLRVRIDTLPGAEPNAGAVLAIARADVREQALADAREARNPERKALREMTTAAIAANLAYLSMKNRTAGHDRIHVDRLTQQINAILARLIQLD